METTHLTAGALGAFRLVINDDDRFDLLERIRKALGASLLGYCLMDTHLHVVAEGPGAHAARWLADELRAYTRTFNRRHGLDGTLLRGPPQGYDILFPEELARTLRYVHENPLKTKVPLVEDPIEYVWSSQRAYAGLTRARIVNVSRALELLGPLAGRVAGPARPLAGLAPRSTPTASPDVLLAAAAQVYGLNPADVAGRGRGADVAGARALFVRLGTLESYEHAQLASAIGRTRVRVTQIAAQAVADDGVRIARTLLAVPAFRRRLPRVAPRVDLPAR